MITKAQFTESFNKEIVIIKHLAEKVTPLQLTHKPTDGQRTLQELMKYLTHIFIMGADSAVTGDGEAYKKYVDSPMPTLENFTAMMDKQMQDFWALVSPLSEEEMMKEVTMWGMTQSRAMHLLGLLKVATAYKMQMFLYMKQSGNTGLNTMNLWAGMDTPPKE